MVMSSGVMSSGKVKNKGYSLLTTHYSLLSKILPSFKNNFLFSTLIVLSIQTGIN